MATPIDIPGRVLPVARKKGLQQLSDSHDSSGGSAANSPANSAANSNINSPANSNIHSPSSCSPTAMGTSYFGKHGDSNASLPPPSSLSALPIQHSPTTRKRLQRIRKMSEINPSSGNINTIPTQVSDINKEWVKLVINQHRIKHFQPPLSSKASISLLEISDCKKSSGDLSTTLRMNINVCDPNTGDPGRNYSCNSSNGSTPAAGSLTKAATTPTTPLSPRSHASNTVTYVFIAKLLPADDPCRVHVFEANVFEKEISIYFELMPCLRQCSSGTKLANVVIDHIPQCIYGSNNGDGAGVLVFECAQEKGYLHPANPAGLSLEQVLSVVKVMARFHAIGSALLLKKGKAMKLRYPFLSTNVYSNPIMLEGAKSLFVVYNEFLKSVPGKEAVQARFARNILMGDDQDLAADEMFRCMRRQIDSPFNAIIHGEMWEKNLLFREVARSDSPREDEVEDVAAAVEKDADNSQQKNTSSSSSSNSTTTTTECVILDWKNAKIASVTKDLAFLLLSSVSDSLRRQHLPHILRTYYDLFCSGLSALDVDVTSCEGMTYEDFAADYAVSTKGAFLQSVCVLVQEMQFMERQAKSDLTLLTVYEKRALNLMNDEILNTTHLTH